MLPERCAWWNLRVVSTLLLVFLTGAAAGALTMELGLRDRVHRSGPAWTEGGKQIFLQDFKTQLDLTPQQANDISVVLDDYGTYYQAIQGQLDEVRATGKSRILQILNDDQRKKFEQMLVDLQTQH